MNKSCKWLKVSSRISLICMFTLFTQATHAIFDITVEGQYISGNRFSNGSSRYGSTFNGYLVKPALHLNYSFSDITFGAGPTISFANITYETTAATTISDVATALRYGGEMYARWKFSRFFQPFVRIELGADSITETVRAYPIALDGPSAGTVLTSQIAEVKLSYRSLYFVTGGGIQAEILSHLDAFIFCGYTAADTATAEVKSFTVNGAQIANVTVSAAFGYHALQAGAGVSLKF